MVSGGFVRVCRGCVVAGLTADRGGVCGWFCVFRVSFEWTGARAVVLAGGFFPRDVLCGFGCVAGGSGFGSLGAGGGLFDGGDCCDASAGCVGGGVAGIECPGLDRNRIVVGTDQ